MSSGAPGAPGAPGALEELFLSDLPPNVHWDFYRVMNGLSDLDWTRFASEVLLDQTAVRLAERKERRTEWVMTQWENRNGRVVELILLLERLELLRPRDIIIRWTSSQKPLSPPAPCPPAPPSYHSPHFDPPPKQPQTPPTGSTCPLRTEDDESGGRPLPRPGPPPPHLSPDQSDVIAQPPQVLTACSSSSSVMCWSYEEVHAGTQGFSPSLQVGEGGFGVVYRATLRNTDCAVKRLKQDCLLDWSLQKESFQTEVTQLTRFRHPNIVDLLGFSEGRGSVCLIYSYMDNRSLEDQLHNECVSLSWSQRLGVVKEASTALQFLHFPPEGERPLIHGDVKSSNILLDRHLVAKLADFGLARFAPRGSSGHSGLQTIGKTATVRGTLAYLPEEYVRDGELGTAVDIYSFGVVLLEVLTGRRALEKDRRSGERYLKDLVHEVEDGPTGSSTAAWRTHLDRRLISGGVAEPEGSMEMVALACRCLDRKRKKRPNMRQVLNKLQDIHNGVRKDSSSSFSSSLSSSSSSQASSSSSSSSSSSHCSLLRPHPLLSSSSSSSLPLVSSSLVGPCETDESRGFSQYDLQFRSNGSSCRSLSSSTRDQNHSGPGPADSRVSQPSVPTEDLYNFAPQHSSCRGPDSLSLVSSLHSLSLGPSVHMNPSKQRFLEKKTMYEQGRIQTPELLSCDDLCEEHLMIISSSCVGFSPSHLLCSCVSSDGGRSRVEFRGPEESDELDCLPAEHH